MRKGLGTLAVLGAGTGHPQREEVCPRGVLGVSRGDLTGPRYSVRPIE